MWSLRAHSYLFIQKAGGEVAPVATVFDGTAVDGGGTQGATDAATLGSTFMWSKNSGTSNGAAVAAAAEVERAASYFTAGRDDEALRHCERALALEPSFEGLKLLGQIAARGGDRRRARHAWRLALATGGDPPQRALVQALLLGVEPA